MLLNVCERKKRSEDCRYFLNYSTPFQVGMGGYNLGMDIGREHAGTQ